MKHKEKIIYCAGIVDGEGYIAIKKTKYARHCPSPTYHERIQIRMTDEGVIVLLRNYLVAIIIKKNQIVKMENHYIAIKQVI